MAPSGFGRFRLAAFVAAVGLGGSGCGASNVGSGAEGSTQVPLQLDVKLSDAQAAATADGEAWVLRAYVLDGSDTPVRLRDPADVASAQVGNVTLPLTLAGAQSRHDVTLVASRAALLYGIGVQLQPASAKAQTTLATSTDVAGSLALWSLAGPMDAGGTTSTLSPQSTAVALLLRGGYPANTWHDRLTAADALSAALAPTAAAQAALPRLGALPPSQLAADGLAATLATLVSDANMQVACGQAMATAAHGFADNDAAASALGSRYDQTLLAFGLAARAVLAGDANTATHAFGPDYAAAQTAALLDHQSRGAWAAYAPALGAFVDTDLTATVGGNVIIGAAPVPGGIDGYAIYAGGPTQATQRTVALGTAAAASGANVTFVVPQKTAYSAAANTLWVFPVSAGRELSAASAAPLKNVQVPSPQLTAVPGESLVTLQWSQIDGASRYNVYRDVAAGMGNATLLTQNTGASYVDTDVDFTRPVYYAVSAVEGGVEGPRSATASATALPSSPPQLTATSDPNGGNVLLQWTAVTRADAYTLYTTLDPNRPLAQAPSQGNLTVTQATLAAPFGTPLRAAVAASVHGQSTALSAEANAPALLLAPQDLQVSTPAAGEVLLAWAPVQGAVSYRIYHGLHTQLTAADANVYTPTNLVLLTDVVDSVPNTFAVSSADANGNVSVRSVERTLRPGVVALQNGMAATEVYGQADGNQNVPALDAAHLDGGPAGVAWSDAYASAFVADPNGNRALAFVVPKGSVPDANVIVGQSDGISRAAGGGATGLTRPSSVHAQGATLWITDAGNRRVLAYADASATQPAATLVVGAADVSSAANAAPSATGFSGPTAARTGGDKLVVVDSAAHRVLLYDAIPTANNAAADVVLGQPDFTSAQANNGGVTAASLYWPSDAYTDGVRLVVYDYGNSRVLIWSTFPTTNAQPADVVLGQKDMVTAGANAGYGVDANVVGAFGFAPHVVAGAPLPGLASNGAALAVADPGNNRVLLYNAIPSHNGVAADGVLGQRLMTTQTANNPPQQDTLSRPVGVSFIGATSLLVADAGNARVLRYAAP